MEPTRGLWRFRLTLGFVRKSAVSGNSTGNRGVRDDEEPVFSVGGLWLGEVTGLRLGDVPVLLGPAWYVRVTEEDLCLGMVSRFALGPLVRPELVKLRSQWDLFPLLRSQREEAESSGGSADGVEEVELRLG